MTASLPKSGLTNRQRRFAEFVVVGMAGGRAYEQAGYSVKCPQDADSLASKMSRNVKVAEYIAELRESAVEAAGMTRDEAVSKLIGIVNAKPSDASMDNPLCDLRMGKAGPYAAFPDKLRCFERLAKMLGWDGPEKFESTTEIKITIGGDA